MNENVKKFIEALSKDEAMQNRVKALKAKHKDGAEPDENTVAAEITAFAKTEGFAFTQAELLEYSKTRELGDSELEAVAGGQEKITEWGRYELLLHMPDKTTEAPETLSC